MAHVQVVFSDEDEQSLQGQQADGASCVVRVRQEIHEDGGLGQMWDDALMDNEQRLFVDDRREWQPEDGDPAV